jgi:hypothetical protein
MNFTHYPLGTIKGGALVTVTLDGTEANIKLLDDTNFNAYRSGRQHRYHGGHYERSPAQIGVPHTGNWHVTVDLGGFGGQVRSSVRVTA